MAIVGAAVVFATIKPTLSADGTEGRKRRLMGFLDTVRTEYRTLSTRQPQPLLYKAASNSMPTWLQATGEANRHEIFYSPEQQARLYMQLAWIQTAINMVATTAITSKLVVKSKKNIDGSEKDIDNHPFEMLLQRPNPMQSRSEFIEATVSYRSLSGNAFWWLNRRNEKRPPDEMWIVPPQQIRPLPDGKQFIRGYMYDPGDGNEIFLEAWEIVHFKRFNPSNMYIGLSAVDSLRMVSVGDLAAERWNTNYFDKHNAKIPGALAFSDPIDDDAWMAMRKDIDSDYGGTNRKLMMLRNVGKGGVEWLNMALSQKDMDFLAGRQFAKEQIYSALAPGLTSILDTNATEANSTAGKNTFIEYAVWPHLVHIAEKVSNDLIPIYGDSLTAEFEDIRITDRALSLQEQLAFASVHTIDEIRAEFYNNKPIGDERGALLLAEVIPLANAIHGSSSMPSVDAQSVTEPPVGTQDKPVAVAQPAGLITDKEKPVVADRPLNEKDLQDKASTAKALKSATAKAHSSGMIALFMPQYAVDTLLAVQRMLPLNSSLTPADEFHMTLVMLGEIADMSSQAMAAINTALYDFAATMPPLTGRYNGVGRFQGVGDDNADALYITFDSKELQEWRLQLVYQLRVAGVIMPSEHGFIPHITLGYVPSSAVTPLIYLPPYDMTFDEVWLALGDNQQSFKLKGVTGTGLGTDNADEMADEIKRFKKWLRKRTNPDASKFSSDLLTDEYKTRILESMTVTSDAKGDGSGQPFFTLMDGRITLDWVKAVLRLNPDDKEAENKLKLEVEKRNARNIQRALAEQLDAMIPNEDSSAGNNEVASRVNQYVRSSSKVKDALTRALQDSADLGVNLAIQQLDTVGLGMDWTLANSAAHDWVSTYSLDLIQGIDKTSQQRTQQLLQRWINNGEPLSTLKNDLTSVFGPKRAATIAATETTRAYSEANRIAYRESKVVQKISIATSVDERVCPICGPLSGKQYPLETGVPDLGFPPFHILCRCWILPIIETPEPKQAQQDASSNQQSSRVFESDEDVKAWGKENYGSWSDSLSEKESEAIKGYQTTDYRWINKELRDGGPFDKESIQQQKLLDAALKKSASPERVVAYRGLQDAALLKNFDNLTGVIISDNAYISTSLSKNVAGRFLADADVTPILADVIIPKGYNAAYVDSVWERGESEMLLPRGQKFRVVKTFKESVDIYGDSVETLRIVLEVVDGL